MIASGNDFADLVDALRNHTAAITSLVATLAPEVPDLVPADVCECIAKTACEGVPELVERLLLESTTL